MPLIGFSTGAVALGDYARALRILQRTSMNAVELSALRLSELPTLIDALPQLNLKQFSYVSVHAPSRFSFEDEDGVIKHLKRIPQEMPIILHPDTIHDCAKWQLFGNQLAIENMDRRKEVGRSAEELGQWFERLPEAQLCLDLAHAHQVDRTMTEAYRILKLFNERVCQIHVSELDSTGHHFSLSYGSMRAYREISSIIPPAAPGIIESLSPFKELDDNAEIAWIELEAERARFAIGKTAQLPSNSIPSSASTATHRAVPA